MQQKSNKNGLIILDKLAAQRAYIVPTTIFGGIVYRPLLTKPDGSGNTFCGCLFKLRKF